MPIVIGLLTVVAGVLTTVQSGSNAALKRCAGSWWSPERARAWAGRSP